MDLSHALISAIDCAFVVIGNKAHRLRFVSAEADPVHLIDAHTVTITVEAIKDGELVRARCRFVLVDLDDTMSIVRRLIGTMKNMLRDKSAGWP